MNDNECADAVIKSLSMVGRRVELKGTDCATLGGRVLAEPLLDLSKTSKTGGILYAEIVSIDEGHGYPIVVVVGINAGHDPPGVSEGTKYHIRVKPEAIVKVL